MFFWPLSSLPRRRRTSLGGTSDDIGLVHSETRVSSTTFLVSRDHLIRTEYSTNSSAGGNILSNPNYLSYHYWSVVGRFITYVMQFMRGL